MRALDCSTVTLVVHESSHVYSFQSDTTPECGMRIRVVEVVVLFAGVACICLDFHVLATDVNSLGTCLHVGLHV